MGTLPFWVISQPNIDGFCFNMGHFKAHKNMANYPDYPDELSADKPVSGCLKNLIIRPSLLRTNRVQSHYKKQLKYVLDREPALGSTD